MVTIGNAGIMYSLRKSGVGNGQNPRRGRREEPLVVSLIRGEALPAPPLHP